MGIPVNKIIKYINNPRLVVPLLGSKGYLRFLSDETYLKISYRAFIGEKLDLNNPESFNAKLQWLKIHDRNPMYKVMVDKYAVREYVASVIGPQYLVKLYFYGDSVLDIDINELPKKFVVKKNNDSGGVSICLNKNFFDLNAAQKKLQENKSNVFYHYGREWPYLDVPQKIIVEEYLEVEEGKELLDYKFLCYNGKPLFAFVCSGRTSSLCVDFYDTEWNHLPFTRHYPNSVNPILPPTQLNLMLELASKLSRGIPFVRVDFYEVDNHVYFGELTFYPGSGFEEFSPVQFDYELGKYIDLKLAYEFASRDGN